jgi:hypothetical protein
VKRALRRGWAPIVCAAVAMTACTKPFSAPELPSSVPELRESFAQQLAANRFIKDFQRNGEELTFSGPGAEGGVAKWRVRIDSAVIEPNTLPSGEADPAHPYKGVVTSSWYSDNQLIQPRGRESHLPIELTDNGLAQICWALWDKAGKRWSWE